MDRWLFCHLVVEDLCQPDFRSAPAERPNLDLREHRVRFAQGRDMTRWAIGFRRRLGGGVGGGCSNDKAEFVVVIAALLRIGNERHREGSNLFRERNSGHLWLLRYEKSFVAH